MMKILKLKLLFAMFTLVMFASCKKEFLNTTSSTATPTAVALATTGNAYAALNGIHRIMYTQYDSQGESGEGGVNMFRDLLGEDFVLNQLSGRTDFNGFLDWTSHRNVNSTDLRFTYRFYYRIISNANVLINGVDGAVGPDADKKIIKGQALAYRAWAHFQLVQLWGKRYDATKKPNTQLGVPLLLINTTDPQPQATVENIYTQINKDLDQAISLLPGYVRTGTAPKSNFNLNVVQGLKARVALVQGDWDLAATNAAAARTGFNLMTNAEMLSGFNNAANQEWIWGSTQIVDHNTFFFSYFALNSVNFNSTNIRTQPRSINGTLWEAISSTDIRKQLWDKTGASAPVPPGGVKVAYHNKKFLAASVSLSIGDVVYMRAAEMYLIEAEARARLGQEPAARTALFTLLKNRNPSYVLSTNTGQALINEILFNRRVELWGEGFRFTDLKRLDLPLDRTGIPNRAVALDLVTQIPAGDPRWQWLFPQDELNANTLIVQNL